MLQRLGKLYMIPNWTPENSVILAEWIVDAYKYEELELVESVLRNPPKKEERTGEVGSNWRLTPDTIHAWMAPALERAAIAREKSQERFKLEEKNAVPLDKVDYDAFRKRLAEGNALKEVKSEPWLKGGDEYSKFKAQRMAQQLKETQNQDGNE